MDISEKKDKKLEPDVFKQMLDAQKIAEKEFAKVEGFPEHLVFGEQKNLHDPKVCAHINDKILWRMVQEIAEATVALKNAKHWRQSKYFTDVNEYLDEVADVFIYFMNLMYASGISQQDLAQAVLKKIEVNVERIKSKY